MGMYFALLPLLLLVSGGTAAEHTEALAELEDFSALLLVQVGSQYARPDSRLRRQNATREPKAAKTSSWVFVQGHRAGGEPGAEQQKQPPPKDQRSTVAVSEGFRRPAKNRTPAIGELPHDAARAAGVEANSADDGAAFISSLVVNIILMLVFLCFFMNVRRSFPMTYQNNVALGTAPTVCLGSTKEEVQENLSARWGWLRASLGAKTDDVAETRGLDMAMLLEFSSLGMRMLARIGIPMIFIIGPMNCAFGGQPAWEIGDYLSSLSFGNVEHGSWLYWVHAFVVWYVVFVVQASLYGAQEAFLERRFKWLRNLDDKRALTVLVEGIPDEYQSDDALKSFFGRIFNDANIASAYVVKDTKFLADLVQKKEAADHGLAEAMAQWDKEGRDPAKRPRSWTEGDRIEYLTAELELLDKAIDEERTRIKQKSAEIGGVNLHSGFVTFKERKYAELASTQSYSSDLDVWTVEPCPPEPTNLIWSDLQRPVKVAEVRTLVGYACIVGLYFAYMPLVIAISKLAVTFDGGPIWEAFAPTVGLQVMVSFLPTFLLIIFRWFFTLKADAWAQHKLMTIYFWFNIVFVVLVAAIGRSVAEFTIAIFTEPAIVPELLGATMPDATHFYMNFLVLQWASHMQNLMRIVMLAKFKAFSMLFEEDRALELSEPEDQDYYGIGSRSARFAINMVIGIVFGTLSPPVNFLCWVNFAVCRVVYGYLIPFAESKKPDLGGVFFVTQLEQLFVGNIIYCLVMTGVLSGRANRTGWLQPATISALSLIYVIRSMQRFKRAYSWEKLPVTEVVDDRKKKKKSNAPKGEYVQPELFPEKFG